MHCNGSKKEKRYGMTAGGNVVSMNNDKKTYHLCSYGNRNIIQSSYWEKEIDEAVIMLNHLNEDFTGSKVIKFYKLS